MESDQRKGMTQWISGLDCSIQLWDHVTVGFKLLNAPEYLDPICIDGKTYVNSDKYDKYVDKSLKQNQDSYAKECFDKMHSLRCKYKDALGMSYKSERNSESNTIIGLLFSADENLPETIDDIEDIQAPILFGRCKSRDFDNSTDKTDTIIYWHAYACVNKLVVKKIPKDQFKLENNETIQKIHSHYNQEFARIVLHSLEKPA